MKIKTSVAISDFLLVQLDELVKTYHKNRSALFEEALSLYLAQIKREKRNQTDLKIINKKHARLNQEAEDVLSYQVEI